MAMWDMEVVDDGLDGEFHFVQSGYDEMTCRSIIRYVDERINEDPSTSDVRGNNFLKRVLEQGLFSLAGILVADAGVIYRQTQLVHDLLRFILNRNKEPLLNLIKLNYNLIVRKRQANDSGILFTNWKEKRVTMKRASFA